MRHTGASVSKGVAQTPAPASEGHSQYAAALAANRTSPSYSQTLHLMSQMAEQDLYDSLRPFLVAEGLITGSQLVNATEIREDVLKSLARKWNLHKEPGFWRVHNTKFKLAQTLAEYGKKKHHILLGHSYSHQQGGKDDVESAFQNVSARIDNERLPEVRPSTSTSSVSSRGVAALRTGLHPYSGDKFSTRGDYGSSVVYLSRYYQEREPLKRDSEGKLDPKQIPNRRLSTFVEMFNKPEDQTQCLDFLQTQEDEFDSLIETEQKWNRLKTPAGEAVFFGEDAYSSATTDDGVGLGDSHHDEQTTATVRNILDPNVFMAAAEEGTQSGLRHQCSLAVRDISRNPKARSTLWREGTLRSLRKMLSTQKVERDIKIICIEALANITGLSPKGRPYQSEEITDLQDGSVVRLDTNAISKISDLGKLVLSGPTDPKARTQLMTALFNLSCYGDLHHQMLFEGAISCVMQMIPPVLERYAKLGVCLSKDLSSVQHQNTDPNFADVSASHIASVAYSDALCLSLGIRALCNFSGCAQGASQLLRNGVVSYLGGIWDWMTIEQRFCVASHLAHNIAHFSGNATRAFDEGAVQIMVDACADALIVEDKHAYVVLARTVAAISHLTHEKAVISSLLNEDALSILASAALVMTSDSPLHSLSQSGNLESNGNLLESVDDLFSYTEGINVLYTKRGAETGMKPSVDLYVLRRCAISAICRLSWDANNHLAVSSVHYVRALLSAELYSTDGPSRKICATAISNLLSTDACASYWSERQFINGAINALQVKNCYEKPFICQTLYNATRHESFRKFCERMADKDSQTANRLIRVLVLCLQESLKRIEEIGDGSTKESAIAKRTLYTLADGGKPSLSCPGEHMIFSYCVSSVRNLSTIPCFVDFLSEEKLLIQLLDDLVNDKKTSDDKPPLVSLNCLYDVVASISNMTASHKGRGALLQTSVLAGLVPVATRQGYNIVERTRKRDEDEVKKQFVESVKRAVQTAESALETFEESNSLRSRSSRNVRTTSVPQFDQDDHPMLRQAFNCELMNEESQRDLVKLQGLAEETKKQCAIAISSLSSDVGSQAISTSSDVINALICLCDFDDGDGSVKIRVTSALNSLVSNPKHMHELVDSGAIPKVVNLCGSNFSEVRRNCIQILSRLSSDESLAHSVVEAGAVKAILVAALVRGADTNTERLCALTLYNLLRDKSLRYTVLSEGVSWALKKLSGSSDVLTERVAALTIYRLAMDLRAQSTLVNEGGLRCVINFLRNLFTGDEEDHKSSSGTECQEEVEADPMVEHLFSSTLATVSALKGNEVALIQEGAVDPLVELVVHAIQSDTHVKKRPLSANSSDQLQNLFAEKGEASGEEWHFSDYKLRKMAAIGLFRLSSVANQSLRNNLANGRIPGAMVNVIVDSSAIDENIRLVALGTVAVLLWNNYDIPKFVRNQNMLYSLVKCGVDSISLESQRVAASLLHYVSCRQDLLKDVHDEFPRLLATWLQKLSENEKGAQEPVVLQTISLCCSTLVNMIGYDESDVDVMKDMDSDLISITLDALQNLVRQPIGQLEDGSHLQLTVLADIVSVFTFQVSRLLLYEQYRETVNKPKTVKSVLTLLASLIGPCLEMLTPMAFTRVLFSFRLMFAYSSDSPRVMVEEHGDDLNNLVHLLVNFCREISTRQLDHPEGGTSPDLSQNLSTLCEDFGKNERANELSYEAFCHAARCLCHLAGNSSTRSIILTTQATDAFIVASELQDVDSFLRYACLRALCQLAIASEDPHGIRLPKEAQSMLQFSGEDLGGNSAVSALIAVMGADDADNSSLNVDPGYDRLQENFKYSGDGISESNSEGKIKVPALETSVCTKTESRLCSLPNVLLYQSIKDSETAKMMEKQLCTFFSFDTDTLESFSTDGEFHSSDYSSNLLSVELFQAPPDYIVNNDVLQAKELNSLWSDERLNSSWGQLDISALQASARSEDSTTACFAPEAPSSQAPRSIRTSYSKPTRGYKFRKTQYLSANVASAVLRSYEINGHDRKAVHEDAIIASLASIGIDVASRKGNKSDANDESDQFTIVDSSVELKLDGVGISDFEYPDTTFVEEQTGHRDAWEIPFLSCVEPVAISERFEQGFTSMTEEEVNAIERGYSAASQRFSREHQDNGPIDIHHKIRCLEDWSGGRMKTTHDRWSSVGLMLNTSHQSGETNMGLSNGSKANVEPDMSLLQEDHPMGRQQSTVDESKGQNGVIEESKEISHGNPQEPPRFVGDASDLADNDGNSSSQKQRTRPRKQKSKTSPNVRKRKTVSIKEKSERPGEAAIDTIHSQRRRMEAQARRRRQGA